MSTKTTVSNPSKKSNAGFLWAIVALLVIGAIVVGYIVYRGQQNQAERYAQYQEDIGNVQMVYGDSQIKLTTDASGAEEVELFEDFSCSYCADLALDTDERMLAEIQDGNLTVNITPLNFLDSTNDGHSTQALAATLALADKGEANAYWSLRNVLMHEQQSIYNQWSPEDFAEAARAVGASDEAVDAIANGEYLEEATEVAAANSEYLQQQTGSVSSPSILLDGEELPIQDYTEWIDYVLES